MYQNREAMNFATATGGENFLLRRFALISREAVTIPATMSRRRKKAAINSVPTNSAK
jgi:hypothetical protein